MKRFFTKFLSIKFLFAIYLCVLLGMEILKTKPDSIIVSILITAILTSLGIREYAKGVIMKNNLIKNENPSGPDGHLVKGPGG